MSKGKRSAGVLGVRVLEEQLEYFLVHPGGPYFRNKDNGFWTIPKGLVEDEEDALVAAKRELVEETGFDLPEGPWIALGQIRQKGGKVVEAWAVAANGFDPGALESNTFEIEWPPRSGRRQSFPEVDRAAWLTREAAEEKLNAAQIPLLDRAAEARAQLGL